MSMERKVGEEFFSVFYGTSYEVFETSRETCEGCAFFNGTNLKGECKAVYKETGHCYHGYRKDMENVIFKKVWREKQHHQR